MHNVLTFCHPWYWCLLHLFWRHTVIVQEMDNIFWHVAMDSMEKAVKPLWVTLLFYAVIDETLYCSLRACTVSYLNENDILKMNLYVDHKECPLVRGKNSCSVSIWLGPLLSIHLQEESTYGSCLSAMFNWILKFRQQVELLSELNWRCSFLLVVKLDWDYCIVFLGRTVLLSRWALYKNYYCYYYDYY